MVLMRVKLGAGLHERWPKMLIGELENNFKSPGDIVGKLA
jgi:hypothetical protein